MIRIQQLNLSLTHSEEDLEAKILKLLNINKEQIKSYHIVKKSIDARKKNDIKFIYTIDVYIENESNIINKINNNNIMLTKEQFYEYPKKGIKKLNNRPIVVGSGPAGLFATLLLAKQGYKPILIEQGEPVEVRIKTVNHFWDTNQLNINSNVQFGEGGAGTFSDGKLNTLVKDKYNRNKLVLETFVKHGANSDIIYTNKPHIGTDILCKVVKSMREEIISLGGEVRFNSKLTDLIINDNQIRGITINNKLNIYCEVLVLAIGHSARDTFRMIEKNKMELQQKAFAIGLRIEHPQDMISESQYGNKYYTQLPPADYKLVTKTSNGRNVYSFCMCPGGYVINASSEDKRLVINGMSNSDREGKNANSAIIVSVTEKDFMDSSPLSGISFVQELESRAYQLGNGNIPVQLLKDFKNNIISKELGQINPSTKGSVQLSNINTILPEYMSNSIIEGIHKFGKMIKGFDRDDAVLSAIETRTSSPVRIVRNDQLESNIEGIYPCGEGAGYAGGITSAAMDGIKVFEAISKVFTSF